MTKSNGKDDKASAEEGKHQKITLPQTLTSDAKEQELADAVSKLREERAAELENLRKNKRTLTSDLPIDKSSQSKGIQTRPVLKKPSNMSLVTSMKNVLQLDNSKRSPSSKVETMDSFFQKQRSDKVKDFEKKGEASNVLHNGVRGESQMENFHRKQQSEKVKDFVKKGEAANVLHGGVRAESQMDSFFHKQRSEKVKDLEKKGEAANILHGGTRGESQIESFHMKQRSESVKDIQKKGEAAEILHGFGCRGVSPTPLDTPVSQNETRKEVAESVDEDATKEETTDFDYKQADYRAFMFCIHEDFGIVLLHCTRKRKKGHHFQLPGGHVDVAEFISAAKKNCESPQQQLLLAAKMAAAREMWEETGINVMNELDRLQPAPLRSSSSVGEDRDKNGEENIEKKSSNLLSCEHKHRIFFFLLLDDHDFVLQTNGENSIGLPKSDGLVSPLCSNGSHLKLKLSNEHSGFTFEKDMMKAADLVKQHSGGKCAEALRMALMHQDTTEQGNKESQGENREPFVIVTDEQVEGVEKRVKKPPEKDQSLLNHQSVITTTNEVESNVADNKPIQKHEEDEEDEEGPSTISVLNGNEETDDQQTINHLISEQENTTSQKENLEPVANTSTINKEIDCADNEPGGKYVEEGEKNPLLSKLYEEAKEEGIGIHSKPVKKHQKEEEDLKMSLLDRKGYDDERENQLCSWCHWFVQNKSQVRNAFTTEETHIL